MIRNDQVPYKFSDKFEALKHNLALLKSRSTFMFKLFSIERVFPKTKLQIYYLILFVSYLGHHKNNYKYEFSALFICFCGKYCFVLEMPGKNKVGSILIKTCQFLYRWKKPNLCFFHSTLKFLIILLFYVKINRIFYNLKCFPRSILR